MQIVIEKKNLYIIFILIVVLLVCFSIVMEIKSGNYLSSEDYFASNSSSWLRLYYDGDLADLYGKHIDQLRGSYDRLKRDSYYEINSQFLEIPFFPGAEIFLYGYEEGHSDDAVNEYSGVAVSNVKAMQLSENALIRFHLSLWQGELFVSCDYQDGDIVPILLGYEYRGTFKIGDKFEGAYIGKPLKFQVIGILDKNSHVMISGMPRYLDRYIVMPSINCLDAPASLEEDLFQVRHYVNKLGGWFEHTNGRELKVFKEEIAYINKVLPGRIETYSVNNAPLVEVVFANIVNIEQAALWISVFLVIVLAIICPLLYFRLQIKSISLLCVNILFGISYTELCIKCLSMFIFMLTFANISAFIILFLSGFNFPLQILIIDIISIVILISLDVLFLREAKLIANLGGAGFAGNTKHL